MAWLLKATKGRVALWVVLGTVWFLFLPQELAMDPHQRHLSVVGAMFWAIVLLALLSLGLLTWRRYRRIAGRQSADG